VRILIVDDDPDYYGTFKQQLNTVFPDATVEHSEDGIEAEQLLRASAEGHYSIMILDECMGGGEQNGSALLRRLHDSPLQYEVPVIFITSFYNELPAAQIASYGESIRLFLEKAPGPGCPLINAVLLVAEQSADIMKFHPNELFGEPFIQMVLSEVSEHIIKDPQAGYIGLEQQRQIGALIRAYLTSLQMRERWDGDQVLDLTVFLTQSLCGVFNLGDDLTNLLRRFISLEEVLYSIPQYRDHIFHQIKVFLLGFCLLNQMNRQQMLGATVLASESGMKLWFLTSAFHDVGYPIEKMQGWLDRFIRGVLVSPAAPGGVGGGPLIPISCEWGALLGRDYHWVHLLRVVEEVADLYAQGAENAEELRRRAEANLGTELCRLAICAPDHGLYSSLILQNLLRIRQLTDAEMDPVATAVALHNMEAAEAVSGAIGRKLTFSRYPLAFLLAYCDIAQEWGRARLLSSGPRYDSPFGYNVFDNPDSSLLDDTGVVSVDLRYVRDFAPQEEVQWRNDTFSQWIKPASVIWGVDNGGTPPTDFHINYWYGNTHAGRRELAKLTF